MRWILLKALILVLSDKQVLIIVDDECDYMGSYSLFKWPEGLTNYCLRYVDWSASVNSTNVCDQYLVTPVFGSSR